jgi:hypothetical protein
VDDDNHPPSQLKPTPLEPEEPLVPEVPEVPPNDNASATCLIVALYDEPAGFCDVSPVITM